MAGERFSDEITLPRRGGSVRMYRARLAIALMKIASDPETSDSRVLAARLLLHDPALPDNLPYPDEIQKIGRLPKDKPLDLAKSTEQEAVIYFGTLVASHPELRDRLKPYFTPEKVQGHTSEVQKFLLAPPPPLGTQHKAVIDGLLRNVETALQHYSRMAQSEGSSHTGRLRLPRHDLERRR